jgi:hypothetical protein
MSTRVSTLDNMKKIFKFANLRVYLSLSLAKHFESFWADFDLKSLIQALEFFLQFGQKDEQLLF